MKACFISDSFVDLLFLQDSTRSLLIKDLNGEVINELQLSKVTEIKSGNIKMINIEQLKDGTWRLIYSNAVIKDISEIKSLEIHRE